MFAHKLTRSIARPVTRRVINGRRGTSLASQVAALFAAERTAGRVTLQLDPSDPALRFQDQAGTTLVTADGQPYGRANDKSGGGNNVGQVTTTSRPLWKTDGTLSWAQPDGADDSWQSLANFDCSATDKITVIAGFTKSSDAATGVLVELGPTAISTAGTFAVAAPAGAAANIGAYLNGSALKTYNIAATAPVTCVTSHIFDIAQASANEIMVRLNGAVASPISQGGDAGAGSFIASVLNVFRRNNAAAPFNGRLYGLMIFGRLLTADELSLCERYMAQKSGVTL